MLSTVRKDELLSIPSVPLSRLTPEQVYRVAQLVDTALFKAYLAVRPSLVGSLCRLDNFCEVVEVEEQLKERKVSLAGRTGTDAPVTRAKLTVLSLHTAEILGPR